MKSGRAPRAVFGSPPIDVGGEEEDVEGALSEDELAALSSKGCGLVEPGRESETAQESLVGEASESMGIPWG